MEELDEAPSTSSKMDQRDGTPEPVDDTEGMVSIKLPEQLQKITPAEEFISVRHRWNTNEEIASILIAFDRHKEWLVLPQKIRPASGSMLLYNRKVVFYRRDGYCWKKRRNGSTIREDHMKLKVQGLECIYGSYVHSAILPTFHRRCYWLLQNPNIVLIHYLNVPYPEAAKPSIPSLSYELRQKDWTKEELVDQLRPMLSRVVQGTEHDAEEDQKVEQMLEEILPVLMPMQESSKIVQVMTRPLAPAQVTTVSSTPSTTSASSSSLKRPIRKQLRMAEPQSGPQESLQTQISGRPTPLQPTLLSPHLIQAQQLPSLQQHPSGLIPTVHSLSGHSLVQHKSSHPSHTITTSHAQNFSIDNHLPQDSQTLQITGQNNISEFLTQSVASAANTPRFLTIGSDVVITNSSVKACDNQNVDNGNLLYSIPQSQLLPTLSPIYCSQGLAGSPSNPQPHSLSPLALNTMTTVAGQEKGMSPSSSISINHYLQSQESQNPTNSGSQHHFLQQQQQHHYQTVAQQNHSFTQGNLEAQQVKLQSEYLLQQQNQQQVPPVLTLHLKPTNSSSSDSPGFVLSLQGATIVSQHNDQVGFSGFNTNSTQSLNFSNGQGVVLVASQSPSGSLILNRISQNAQHMNSYTPAHSCAPGTSTNKTFPQQTPNSMCPPQFTSTPVAMTTSMFTQSGSNDKLSQVFSYSSPMTTTTENNQCQQHLDSSQFKNIFPLSQTDSKPFPTKGENDMFPVNTHGMTFTGNFSDIKKDSDKNARPLSSFDHSRKDITISSYNSSFLANQSHPNFTGASSNGSSESSTVFSLQQVISQPHQAQVLGLNHPQQRLESSSDLMAGPSGLNSSVKDMITNPNSCDTLDGSFSSLPSADLNLDDLLDLNDLDDVSDLGCSPFTPTDMSQQPLTNNDTAASEKDVCNDGGMNLMTQGQSTLSGNLSPFDCVGGNMAYHHQSQQHGDQQPSTSALHPGAQPPSSLSYTPMLLGSSPEPHQLTCDNDMNHQVSGHDDDLELDTVIKDFSPDWAYTKTNTKILVAGPWFSENASYTCVFDGEHLPAILLQPGLLRCYTHYHNPGYVTLQVARNGVVISNCEVFEFCDRECRDTSTTHPEWFAIDSNQLKLLLVERLDHLRRRFVISISPLQDNISNDPETLESALVHQVQSMLNQTWTDSNLYPKAGQHNLTLLHLAAGLGFAKLISCLIRWRMDNSCVALEFEVDAQSVDSHACTPLMWACALGKIDAALTLYHWNASPLKMCNKDGLLPLTLARQKGHYNLANQVEQLERAKEQQQHQMKEEHERHQSTSAQKMDLTCSHSSSVSGHQSHSAAADVRPSNKGRKGDSELKDELTVPPPSFPKPGKPGPKLIRRYSEQVITHQTRPLNKRNSIDILPSGQEIDQAAIPSMGSPLSQPVRDASSEGQLPVSPDMAFVAPPAPRLLLEDEIDEPSGYAGEPSTSKMDTDEIMSVRGGSPIIDVERISSDEEVDGNKEGSKHQMVTLANQIIAAIPERIKLSPPKGDDVDDASSGRGRSESHSSLPSQGSPRPSSFGDDSGISTPMTDSLAFEEYRYPEFGTPASSLSPDSTCLPSPYSPYSFTLDSPPPTTAEFTEYFNAPTTYMEKDFSQLTLSDQEQRKLYEAAKVIQNAYRHYRDKQQQQQQQLQQQKEIEAAILIQSYYRRYKTYAYYKKMSQAAVLIQNQFRTYYAKRKKRGDTGATTRRESERLKKGRNQSVIIQQRFRSHYQRRSLDGKEGSGQVPGAGDAPDSSPPPHEANSQYLDETPPTDVDGEPVTASDGCSQAATDGNRDEAPPATLRVVERSSCPVEMTSTSHMSINSGQSSGESCPGQCSKTAREVDNLTDSGCVEETEDDCGVFKME